MGAANQARRFGSESSRVPASDPMTSLNLMVKIFSLMSLGVGSLTGGYLDFFPLYEWWENFEGKPMFLLENSFLFKLHTIDGGDVFFFLCPVKEGEGEDGYDFHAPIVLEFICRGKSVFMMGPSRKVSFRDEAHLKEDR